MRFVCLLSLTTSTWASNVSNVLPRLDTSGAIIDAHDGHIFFDATVGKYLYYAAGYGPCEEPPGLNGCSSWCDGCGCGFYFNHSVNLYTTSDFVTWEAHGNVLPISGPDARPNRVLFSPKVIRNAANGEYVMWYNLVRLI